MSEGFGFVSFDIDEAMKMPPEKFTTAALAAGVCAGFTAVSYTHLDVYKRQPIRLPLLSKSAPPELPGFIAAFV